MSRNSKSVAEAIEIFRRFLGARGLRWTRDRVSIIEAVYATHAHFTMDDLFIAMRVGGERLSKTTLYRNLPLLIESGLIRRVENDTANGVFEHVLGHPHHDHLICLGCGAQIEFMSDRIEKAQDDICREHEFEPVRHRLGIWGYCKTCRGKELGQGHSEEPGASSRQGLATADKRRG